MSNNFVLKVGVKIDGAQVQKELETLSKKSVISTVAKFDGKEAIKTVTAYTGKLGELYTATRYSTLSGVTLSNTITKVTENVKDAKGAISRLGSEMVTTVSKVLKFAAATAVIMAFKQAVSEAVEIIHNFDDSLTEFNKVTDFTDKQLKSLISDLGEVGKTVARTTTEMVDAATEFAKSGNYSESQLVALSKTATMYQNIADSELSAGDAASYIISQMKAFNISAEDSMQIIDKTNEVSNNFAVSSTDISSALTKTSSSLSAYGNTIDDTIGLITAGTEIMTHQAGKVGRGLRSIGANIANLASSAGELSFQVNGATETISLLNKETGDMLSTRAVLEEISKSWEKMTNEEKAALAIQLSGKTQIDVFTSVLSNFDTVIKASETSMNSFGSAERENEKVMESLTAKINQMKTEFESLVLGTDGQEFLKNLADIVTNILKIINTLGGLKTILVAIGGILITLNINKITLNISYLLGNLSKLKDGVVTFFKSLKDIKGILSTLKGSLEQYGAAMQVATMNSEGLALAEEAVAAEGAAAASAIQGIIGVAALLVVGTMAVVSAIKQQREEQERARKETIENLSNELSAMDSLLKQLKNETISKEQLASLLSGTLSDAYIDELNAIKDTNAAREKAIELVEKEAKAKAEELLKTGLTDYQEAGATLYDDDTKNTVLYSMYDGYTGQLYPSYDFLGSLADWKPENYDFSSLYEYRDWLSEVIDKYHEEMFGLDENSKKYKQLQNGLSEVQKAYSDVTSKIDTAEITITQFNQALELLGKTKDYNIVKTEKEKKAEEDALEVVAAGYGITVEQAKELQQAVEENGTTWDEEAEKAGYVTKALEGSVEAINNAESAFKDAMSALDDFSSSYQTLSSAVDEYNSSGELSLSTIDNLLKLSNDYLSALQFQDGQLHLNEESLSKIANARIDEAEAMAVQEAQAQLAAIAEGNYNQTLAESSSASSIAQIAAQAAGASISASAEDALVAAESWATAWEAIANGYVKIDTNNWEQVKQVEESLKTRLGTIEQLRGNLGKFTSTTKGNTKATRDNTKAVDENTEALKKKKEAQQEVVDGLEDEIDEYERVIKYIQGKLKDEIDALKDARDAEVDKINEKIDSLEKLKDAEDKYWEDRISELRAANDELEKGIELEQLEEALAKAKSQKVKVYKDGKFVWDTNSEAVSKATDDIAAFKRKQAYEDQLAELEHFREQSKDKYDAQIRDYEEHIQKIKDGYDKQIAALQKYLDRFNLGIKKYEKEQDRLLALQKTGIDFESNNWKNRLKNLDGFVKKYTNKLKSLKKEQKELNKISKELSKLQSNTNTNNSGGGGGDNNNNNKNNNNINNNKKYTPPKIEKPYTVFKILGEYKTSGEATSKIAPLSGEGMIKYKDKYVVYRKVGIYGDSLTASARATGLTVASKGKSKYGFKQFANGTPYVDKDQIALVGENPNKELVIGSKINNGVMMKLNQGTGVVNAQSTNTLAKMLNSINPNRSFNMADNTKEVSQTFNFDSIVLPNVTNGDEFANEISTKFSQYVRQYKLKF